MSATSKEYIFGPKIKRNSFLISGQLILTKSLFKIYKNCFVVLANVFTNIVKYSLIYSSSYFKIYTYSK